MWANENSWIRRFVFVVCVICLFSCFVTNLKCVSITQIRLEQIYMRFGKSQIKRHLLSLCAYSYYCILYLNDEWNKCIMLNSVLFWTLSLNCLCMCVCWGDDKTVNGDYVQVWGIQINNVHSKGEFVNLDALFIDQSAMRRTMMYVKLLIRFVVIEFLPSSLIAVFVGCLVLIRKSCIAINDFIRQYTSSAIRDCCLGADYNIPQAVKYSVLWSLWCFILAIAHRFLKRSMHLLRATSVY